MAASFGFAAFSAHRYFTKRPLALDLAGVSVSAVPPMMVALQLTDSQPGVALVAILACWTVMWAGYALAWLAVSLGPDWVHRGVTWPFWVEVIGMTVTVWLMAVFSVTVLMFPEVLVSGLGLGLSLE